MNRTEKVGLANDLYKHLGLDFFLEDGEIDEPRLDSLRSIIFKWQDYPPESPAKCVKQESK